MLQADQQLLDRGGVLGSLKTRWRAGWRGMLVPGVGDPQRIVDALELGVGSGGKWAEGVDLKIVAWDVQSWERQIFDKDSGIDAFRAAAGSAALPPFYAPMDIAGRCYIDGAVGSNTHADLVGDVDRVIILSALSGEPPTTNVVQEYVQRRHRVSLEREIAILHARGIGVTLYEPPEDLRDLIWRNPFSRTEGWKVYDQMSPR